MAITPGPGYQLNAAGNGVIPISGTGTAQAQGLGVYSTPAPTNATVTRTSTSTPTPATPVLTSTYTPPAPTYTPPSYIVPAATPTLSSASTTNTSLQMTPSEASGGAAGLAQYNARIASQNGASTSTSRPFTPSLSSNPTIGATAATGDALYSSLNSAFDTSPTAQTIMQNYTAQADANNKNLANSNKSLQDYYSGQSAEQQIQGAAAQQSAITASKGLINPSAMGIIQDQSNALLASINKQMSDAIASNNSSAAEQLSNAAATEMTNMVAARQNFLSNYFATQSGAQSEASFQTPIQQAVMSLASTYPQAGILPSDTISTAQLKVTQTPQYLQNVQLGQANIKAALAGASASSAQAAASGAQAGLTNTQNQQAQVELQDLQQSGQYSSDVQSLVHGADNDATLQAKYGNYPNGIGPIIIANIENSARAQGWNPQQSALTSLAQKTNTEAANSGNPLTEGTAVFSNFLNAAGQKINNSVQSLSPSTKTSGTTSNGLQYVIQ